MARDPDLTAAPQDGRPAAKTRSAPRDRPVWKGQRPWYEIWFAVVLDDSRRRALWVRQTFFVPTRGDARAKIWGAWFDADAVEPAFAAKRHAAIGDVKLAERDDGDLIRIFDSAMSVRAATGSVEGLSWKVGWDDGRSVESEVPSWLPVPTHARPIVYDAPASGSVVIGDRSVAVRGRATAMHLWGKRRVPTLQWIWAPWLGGAALEVQAVSFRDSFSLGISTLRIDGPGTATFRGRPATAAHSSGLVTSRIAGARKHIHARAWAEPREMVGYVYRDTDDRDVMVAQSDIGSAQLEVFTRAAPVMPWKLVEDRRVAGGVAVEIHQHAPLPEVDYIGWDATTRATRLVEPATEPAPDSVAWPDVTAVVALGLTYGDHVRETGQKLDISLPPVSFLKHVRALAPGGGATRIPESDELSAVLDAVEPGLAAAIRERFPLAPAVMDYEGELALVALDAIDETALAAGAPQPFGVAVANDLTARFCQVFGEDSARQLEFWSAAKSFPRFLPLAPRVWAPPGGLVTIPELTLSTRVNGALRQQASTKLIVYGLPAIVRAAASSLGRSLARGDVILTGTPSGVGMRMSPLQRRVVALVAKDRFRKAELMVSRYATSPALVRAGDVIDVDAGPAGKVRTRLTVG